MNPEVKELWLSALRSGEYVQGKNLLHKSYPKKPDKADEFCCLGVLCDIAVKNGVIPEEDLNILSTGDEVEDYNYHAYDSGTAFLPKVVQEWSGVLSDNGEYPAEGRPRSLVYLNDDGFPFASIADVIEENF